jgi:hypothetical protein
LNGHRRTASILPVEEVAILMMSKVSLSDIYGVARTRGISRRVANAT